MLTNIDVEIQQSWKSFEDRKHFTMIGNFMHAPNVDAVLLLKRTIWKQIRAALPIAELHIYGAYAPQQILELHNLKEGFLIKGYAKSSEEIVRKSRVVLAPLQFGAGIKGKLTEAMLCGTPSVTTTIGAEGMHADFSWNGFITDDLNDFAQKAVQLYLDASIWKKITTKWCGNSQCTLQ